MGYVKQVVRDEDRKKIIRDAGSNESIQRSLLIRGGHFENNPNLIWAIDRELDSYVFSAPRPPMTPGRRYCFFYGGLMYLVYFEDLIKPVVYFDKRYPVDQPLSEEVKSLLKEALRVHGYNGGALEVTIGDEG